MGKREFVLLAHKYTGKEILGGWWISEKLDGMRCIWDGGISRGLPKTQVPWANTAKDARYRTPPIATGLWTRYGNVIHAPDWWLDSLPNIPLDGELYTRSANRQSIFATIKDIIPSDDWKFIQYHVFDFVPLDFWLLDGQIKNTGFMKQLKGCYKWAMDRGIISYYPKPMTQFETTVVLMKQKLTESKVLLIHPQTKLSLADAVAHNEAKEFAIQIAAKGGEGAIVRSPISYWRGERIHELLKIKPTEDMEGTVIGYTSGRETDKGSKLLGMIGALILKLDNGGTLELSGLTDNERSFYEEGTIWAKLHPGEECPGWIESVYFPRGTRVTFTYRGFSDKKIPQEARFKCIRSD